MRVKFNRPIAREGRDLFLRSPIAFAAEEERPRKKPGEQLLQGTQSFEGITEGFPYANPDELVGKKGLTIFSKMLREDEMLNSATSYLLLATISPGLDIVAGEEDNESERAAEFQRWQFDRMRGTLSQVLLNVLDMAPRGFSVIEPEWDDQMTEGEWAGKQPYRSLMAKNPGYIEFKTDSYGRVAEDGVWQMDYTGTGSGTYNKADLKEVIYSAFWPRDDNPYGSPLLRPAYPYYFASQFVFKQWASFLERFGHPMVIGRHDDSFNDTDKAELLSLCKKLWRNLVTRLHKNVDVELIQPDFKATDQFEAHLRYCNRGKARSLLLPAMVMEHEGATGSLALAKEQGSEGQFVWLLKYFAEQCEAVMNEQAIRYSHIHNFGTKIPQPRAKFKAHVQDDLRLYAEVFGILADKLGMSFSKPELYKVFGQKEPEEGEETLGGRKPQPIMPAFPNGAPQLPGVPPDAEPEEVEKIAAELTRTAFEAARAPMHNRVYSFASSPGDLEDHMSFDQTNVEQDIASRYWSEIGAIVTEEIADATKATAGKGNGVRLSR